MNNISKYIDIPILLYGCVLLPFPAACLAAATGEPGLVLLPEGIPDGLRIVLLVGETDASGGGQVGLATSRGVPEPDRHARGITDGLVRLSVGLEGTEVRVVRVNITIEERLLREIDTAASEGGMSRSGFLADAARRSIRRSVRPAGSKSRARQP